MTWRWVWARSRITAFVVSSLLWLVTGALVPEFVNGYLLFVVVAVLARNARPVLWLSFGARPMSDQARAAVLSALVPIEALRGRHQPEVMISRRRRQPTVVAPTPRLLVFHERLVLRILQQQVTDEQVSVLAIRALSSAPVNDSRLVTAVELYCLPYTLLETAIVSITRPIGQALPFTRFSWKARWLYVVLALGDLWQRGYWVSLVMLALASIATVTTLRWNRAWAAHLNAMTDQSVIRHGFDTLTAKTSDPATLVGGFSWRRPARRARARTGGGKSQ